mmetsp:Transcript_25576/g.35303  ORF Transcript_25576/g.35303 Transcript_25576/m.35303 type:complete len:245 (-) Transcript_25576:8-742(-)
MGPVSSKYKEVRFTPPPKPEQVFGDFGVYTYGSESLFLLKNDILIDDSSDKAFKILSNDGKTEFLLDSRGLNDTQPNGRYFRDNLGNAICYIDRKDFRNGRPAWHMYDTNATKRRVTVQYRIHHLDYDPVFYAWILPAPYASPSQPVLDLKELPYWPCLMIKGNVRKKEYVIYWGNNDQHKIVCQVSRKHIPLTNWDVTKKDHYSVRISKFVDSAFVIALVIIVDAFQKCADDPLSSTGYDDCY